MGLSNETVGTYHEVRSKEEMLALFNELSTNERQVKLNLKLRSPLVGRFVRIKDCSELSAKGMFRFVSMRREQYFSVYPVAENTIILVGTEIQSMIKY